jgi:hypothetical protein
VASTSELQGAALRDGTAHTTASQMIMAKSTSRVMSSPWYDSEFPPPVPYRVVAHAGARHVNSLGNFRRRMRTRPASVFLRTFSMCSGTHRSRLAAR